ncbi:MAG: 7-cyano-7-deazaguanine synthase QueC [Phycisphaerales bacterium JB039]
MTDSRAQPAAPAIVLLSGGLDSATALACARAAGFRLHALTIDYNQRHRAELAAAADLAATLGAETHTVLPLDLRRFGASALTSDTPVPKDRPESDIAEGIPITYVPARNLIFLALALARAESLGAADIFIGVNAIDYSGYPDCRPEFIRAFEATARLATKLGVEGAPIRIHTPLIDLTKAQIIRRAAELGVDLVRTVSCYDPDDDGRACARCDACILRRRGFEQAGVEDVTRYQPHSMP